MTGTLTHYRKATEPMEPSLCGAARNVGWSSELPGLVTCPACFSFLSERSRALNKEETEDLCDMLTIRAGSLYRTRDEWSDPEVRKVYEERAEKALALRDLLRINLCVEEQYIKDQGEKQS